MATTRIRLRVRRSLAHPGGLAELTARLEQVGPDAGRAWGRMTPHQMLVHLADNHDAVLGRALFTTPSTAPKRIIKVLALQLSVRWARNLNFGADPAGVELDPATFAIDRLRAATTLADLAAAELVDFSTPHPIFGRMTRTEWHRWAFLHTDHHLRQFGL